MTYTYAQLEALWTQHGGPAAEAPTAAAIALAESGGNPDAILNTAYPDRPNYHPPAPGNLPEYSVGLWQINLVAHPSYTEAQMLTPTGNVKAALAISSGGINFTPWSTYNSGAYLPHLTGTSGATTTAGATGTSTHPGGLTLQQAWGQLMRTMARAAPAKLSAARHAIVVMHRLQVRR